MKPIFTDTFFKFFFGFVAIIAVAFGVMLGANSLIPEVPNVENVASPSD